jgi:hypothetical protein
MTILKDIGDAQGPGALGVEVCVGKIKVLTACKVPMAVLILLSRSSTMYLPD